MLIPFYVIRIIIDSKNKMVEFFSHDRPESSESDVRDRVTAEFDVNYTSGGVDSGTIDNDERNNQSAYFPNMVQEPKVGDKQDPLDVLIKTSDTVITQPVASNQAEDDESRKMSDAGSELVNGL